MPTIPEFELDIGSRFEYLDIVDLLMEIVAGLAGLPEDDVGTVALAVREATANAISHGNRQQRGKRVVVRAQVTSAGLTVVVSDEGQGFDPSKLPDPLAAPNLLKPSGRGILLMRGYMDEVVFDFPDEGGTVVTMRRAVPAS